VDQSTGNEEHQLNIPPHSIEAEQSVLGSLMISADAWDKVADLLLETDFYNRSHRIVYASILRLVNANQSVDTVTVKDELSSRNLLDDAGGFVYLIELAKNTPSAANIAAYAHNIREKAIVRELIGVAHNIAELGYNPEGRDSKEVLDLAETKVFEIAEKRTTAGEGPVDIKTILKQTVDRLDQLVKVDSEVTGVSTGFHDLDKKTSGLQRSDLIIVAARPSMGKTTFAMNLCENAMMMQDKPVLVFSLEMPAEQLMMRMSMIMIDYLQLMRVPHLSDNRTLEISEISRSLKALAKELQVPVIALSQLNRGLEQRSDKRPINSDLRESGAIEQDADLIMFIYRDEVYNENSEDKGIAEIIIGKQRNGPIGTSRLTFQGQFSRFDNYAGSEYSDNY